MEVATMCWLRMDQPLHMRDLKGPAEKELSLHFICEEDRVQRDRDLLGLISYRKGWSENLAPGLSDFQQHWDCPTGGILSWREHGSIIC